MAKSAIDTFFRACHAPPCAGALADQSRLPPACARIASTVSCAVQTTLYLLCPTPSHTTKLLNKDVKQRGEARRSEAVLNTRAVWSNNVEHDDIRAMISKDATKTAAPHTQECGARRRIDERDATNGADRSNDRPKPGHEQITAHRCRIGRRVQQQMCLGHGSQQRCVSARKSLAHIALEAVLRAQYDPDRRREL